MNSGTFTCIHPLWATQIENAFNASLPESGRKCLTGHAGIVEDCLEPLCHDDSNPLCCDFLGRCEELANADTVASLCHSLEVETVDSLSRRQWLIWASQLKMDLLGYMYCLANFFISPNDDSTATAEEADFLVESYMLLGRGLSFFDRDADAISVLLRFLNLPIDGLEQIDAEAWQQAFGSSPFVDANPNLRLIYARTTAETARFASQRGNEIGAMILESFLQIPPDSIFGPAEDTEDARRLLHSTLRSAFENITLLNTLNSVAILGDIWSFVETRRHIPAIQIFLGFDYGKLVVGVEDSSRVLETDSPIPAKVSAALKACTRNLDPKETLDPDSKLHFFRRLSDELVYVSGDGHTAATVVLESVIGVTSDAYRDRERLAAQLEAGLAGQVKNDDSAATFLWTLGDRLRSTHGRGVRASVQLFEAFIGIQPQDFGDQSKLRDKLYKKSRLARANADNRANVVGVFADCLRMVFRRGPVHALRLLEAFLGLDADDYQNDGLFSDKWSRCDIANVTSFNIPGIIAPYADCLGDVRERGRTHALRLLETACDIRPRGKSKDQIAVELDGSQLLEHLDPDTAIGLVGQLAKTLVEVDRFDTSALSNATDAASLVDAFLTVSLPHVAQNESLAEQLLTFAESNNVLNFLLVFATALASPEVGDDGRAIALLCNCLGLSESDLDSEDLVRMHLQKAAKRFQMSPGVKERLVWNLADVIRQLGTEGELTAVRLLQSSLNAPAEEVFSELGGLELSEQLDFLRVWLLSASIDSEAFWQVLQDTVRVVVTARDELLQSFDQRRDFVHSGRLLWDGVKARVLSWIKQKRKLGSIVGFHSPSAPKSNTELERLTQLLLDTEQFENRMLVEEFRLTASSLAHHSASWPTGLDPERSSLAHEWTTADVRKTFSSWWNGRRPQRARRVDDVRVDTSSGTLSGCLGRVSTVVPESSFQTQQVDIDFVESEIPSQASTVLTPQIRELSDLFTAPCLWIRALFDADGALCWWVFRCNSEQVEYVASDVSHENAHSRLTDANFVFDATVESIWQLYGVWLSDDQQRKAPLNALESFERGRCKKLARALVAEQNAGVPFEFQPGQIDAIESALVTAADKKSLPHAFVAMGRHLCQRLRGTKSVSDDMTILANGWNKCIELLSATPWDDTELHLSEASGDLPVQERWRRNELHDATMLHLKALEAEWDLGLLNSLDGVLDDSTDVMFQVQGPLLAMPLSWLSVGDTPIYSLVHSTSTSISLTLGRAASTMSQVLARTKGIAREQPKSAREALSAIWLKPGDERKLLLGLPLLENSLRELVTEANGDWQVYSACDEPLASSELLRSALSALDHQVELLLIGGHGNPNQAGITLADGLWDGTGMNLANVNAVLLASCAVGRLFQQGTEDVVGLLSRLFVHGARCVVAARWTIGDRETAEFIAEFLEVYLNETDTSPFHVARSFNRARRNLLDSGSRRRDVLTQHTAAAFDVYGFA